MAVWLFVLVSVGPVCPVPPVDAPVVDPFRPPACRWCPGNRGLEYGVVPGQPVRAVLAGQVVFAGPVARVPYVTVRLADGRRLTYGRLETVAVEVGAEVRAGQRLGTTGPTFILTLRRGDEYEDPAPLLAARTRPRLVRLDGGHRPAPRLRCEAVPRWGTEAHSR